MGLPLCSPGFMFCSKSLFPIGFKSKNKWLTIYYFPIMFITRNWQEGWYISMNETVAVGKKGISGSTIKLIGIITMFIDHFAAALLTRILIHRGLFSVMYSNNQDVIAQWKRENWLLYFGMEFLRMVGRLGFPIFCFLLVEGFGKTSSKFKYAIRLGLFALISEIPFDLAFSAKVLEFGYQNVYFTLFLGFLAMCAFDFLGKHKLPGAVRWIMSIAALAVLWAWLMHRQMDVVLVSIYCLVTALALLVFGWRKGMDKALVLGGDLLVLFLMMLLADFLKTDYSGMGVLTIAVMYALRASRVGSIAAGCGVLTIMAFNEIFAFFTLIPVAKYNGERGLKLKYFFYAFYPVHLLLLWLVAYLMGLGGIPVI